MRTLLLVLGGLAAAAVVLMAAAQVQAAPKNTTSLELDCGAGGTVEVQVQTSSSSAAVFDATGEGGRLYLVQSLDLRGYFGEHETEPVMDPIFEFTKEYGNRTGFSETLECTGSFMEEEPGFGTVSLFFDVTLVGK
jgi:hypothetical protein